MGPILFPLHYLCRQKHIIGAMEFTRSSSVWFFILALFTLSTSPVLSSRVSSFIQLPSSSVELESEASDLTADYVYCDSWRLAVETNNAGSWKVVPSKCVNSIARYYDEGQFDRDYRVVAMYALAFAKTVKLGGDGKDAWVFDVDETLLSNLEYYKAHGYGSEVYNPNQFNDWVLEGTAPAFKWSLKLYNSLKDLGFTIFLLTGRDEHQRNITERNLLVAGYSGYERLLLRGSEDQGKDATGYKSGRRAKLVEEGYRIHGSSGDQWSDLLGYAVAERSFKVPNPMYYIP